MANEIERYEIIAECYKRRYGQMAPGKDPGYIGPSIDDLPMEENQKRWERYLGSVNERADLLNELIRYHTKLATRDKHIDALVDAARAIADETYRYDDQLAPSLGALTKMREALAAYDKVDGAGDGAPK